MKIVCRCVYILLLIVALFISKEAIAKETTIVCDNRFATLVNPVRGRDLWIDKNINFLKDQYSLVRKYNFPTTWLLQYDALEDEEIFNVIKQFDSSQEIGVFLEISPLLAEKARVIYPNGVSWFSPQAVFLSGYPQSDRRRLIDKLFLEFKLKFGFYPKSVGAWWIDSYSLNYMKDKYGIKSAMIVADQKTTDNYGVWGQWWGVPYYPSKANVLIPASSLNNKLDVVVIQWAQRDPLFAVGDGSKYSNYSLQANDYIRQGKDTGYFNKLVDAYLNCKNPIGQVTIGLETGIESAGYLDEYKNQLDSLKKRGDLEFVTMEEFSKHFESVYPDFPKQETLAFQDSVWNLTTHERYNKLFGDYTQYNQDISFADYFILDKAQFLDRNLQNLSQQKNSPWFPWFLIAGLGLLFLSYYRKLLTIWAVSMLFALGAFGLILRSYYQTGWRVYFGPELPNLEIFQILLILGPFFIIWLINKSNILRKYLLNLWLLSLVFGIDFLLQQIRFSHFSGKYYSGIIVDTFKFIGINFKSIFELNIINQDFPSYISAAFLKINFDRLWENPISALLLYPVGHILLALVVGFILVRLPGRIQKLTVTFLIILFLLHVSFIFGADPRRVEPILLQYP